jgi:hypothetical protein
MDKRENIVPLNILLAKRENCFLLCHQDFKISCMYKHRFLIHSLFVFLALQPLVVVFSQPGSGL